MLVVGGPPGLTGAACLAARAAFRADAGYVRSPRRSTSLPTLETLVLEAVKRPLEEVARRRRARTRSRSGPASGGERGALVRGCSTTELPVVVDADACFGLEPFARDAPTVLTPHSGELARLLGAIGLGRRAPARGRRARGRAFGCVVLLKGADTLVAAPGEGVARLRPRPRRSRPPAPETCSPGHRCVPRERHGPREAAAAAARPQQARGGASARSAGSSRATSSGAAASRVIAPS